MERELKNKKGGERAISAKKKPSEVRLKRKVMRDPKKIKEKHPEEVASRENGLFRKWQI